MVTIDASSTTINWAMITTARICQRLGSGAEVAGAVRASSIVSLTWLSYRRGPVHLRPAALWRRPPPDGISPANTGSARFISQARTVGRTRSQGPNRQHLLPSTDGSRPACRIRRHRWTDRQSRVSPAPAERARPGQSSVVCTRGVDRCRRRRGGAGVGDRGRRAHPVGRERDRLGRRGGRVAGGEHRGPCRLRTFVGYRRHGTRRRHLVRSHLTARSTAIPTSCRT